MKGIGNMRGKNGMDCLRKKVALLRRMGLFNPDDASITVRRAIAEHDLREAYRLVHDVFVESGYIDPQPHGMRLRPFEALPETATFVADAGGQIVAVMSIVEDDEDLGLPSDKAFGKELDALRREGRRLSEITNLAVGKAYRRSNAFSELTRACFAQALWWGCDDIVIAISPGHAPFFQDVLQFDPVGDQRSYSSDKLDIVEAKRMDLREIEGRWKEADRLLGNDAFLIDYYYHRNPYHARVGPVATLAKRAFLDPERLRRLFVAPYNFLDAFTAEQRQALCRRWGQGLYAEVYYGHRPELAIA